MFFESLKHQHFLLFLCNKSIASIVHFQMDSAMSMTPFSDVFLGSRVNNMYTQRSGSGAASGGSLANPGPVYVNLTLQLAESAETLRPAVKHEIQKHLTGVIHRRSNNIGSSALWVDTPPGSISQIHGAY